MFFCGVFCFCFFWNEYNEKEKEIRRGPRMRKRGARQPPICEKTICSLSPRKQNNRKARKKRGEWGEEIKFKDKIEIDWDYAPLQLLPHPADNPPSFDGPIVPLRRTSARQGPGMQQRGDMARVYGLDTPKEAKSQEIRHRLFPRRAESRLASMNGDAPRRLDEIPTSSTFQGDFGLARCTVTGSPHCGGCM